MNTVNETVDLINVLASVVDDSQTENVGDGILGITIDSLGTRVQLGTTSFLESFVPKYYDVENDNGYEYPYTLTNEVDGVKFFTIFDDSELAEIEKTYPKHYQYISEGASL